MQSGWKWFWKGDLSNKIFKNYAETKTLKLADEVPEF